MEFEAKLWTFISWIVYWNKNMIRSYIIILSDNPQINFFSQLFNFQMINCYLINYELKY
jgi:hypothetical protein